MDLSHPYHIFRCLQTAQINAQENKPKPAQQATDGQVTRVWPQRAEAWQAQSLTHLCKGKPWQDQSVSIFPKVNKLLHLLKVEQSYTTVKKIKSKSVIWRIRKERNVYLSWRKTFRRWHFHFLSWRWQFLCWSNFQTYLSILSKNHTNQ